MGNPMLDLFLLAGGTLVLGAMLGLLFGRRLRGDVTTQLSLRDSEVARLRPLADQVPSLREQSAANAARLESVQAQLAELETIRSRATQFEAENAGLKAQLDAAQSNFSEQIKALTQLRQDMEEKFQNLAGKALQTNAEEFLRSATLIFENQKNMTNAEIEKRAKDISELVKPLSESLVSYDLALKDLEAKRISDVSAVGAVLNDIRMQHAQGMAITSNLVNALRASPKTRGRWGEETLRRVMEMSGMVERCDFETEKFFPGDENLRPDAVISLAGGRTIVVDAKTPFSAYLDAVTAGSDEERELLLKRHAQQMRERLTNLSQKSYSDRVSGTADCVVMFVPGDNFVAAAFERDPNLFEDGINARVLICTPTTFIALAKAISYGWRQERLAQSAVEVGQMAKELYGRLGTLGDHIVSLGKNINATAKKYNEMVGSLETKVMPHARRFKEMGVGTSDDLPELNDVDTVVKFPQPGRDLLISKGET